MNKYEQLKDESAASWVERLARVSTAGLSDYLLFVLGSWRRDAAEQAGGVKPLTAAHAAGKAATPAAPLQAAKDAVRALSAPDLARFTFWLGHGRAD